MYRLQITLFVEDETVARQIFELLKKFKSKYRNLVRGVASEHSFIQLHVCNHEKNEPCKIIGEWRL